MPVPTPRTGAERSGRARRAQRAGDLYAHPSKAKAVREWLAAQPRDSEGDIVASQRDVSDGTGIPVATARRALRLLIDTEQIVVVEVGTGSYYASRYRFPAETSGRERGDAASVPVA